MLFLHLHIVDDMSLSTARFHVMTNIKSAVIVNSKGAYWSHGFNFTQQTAVTYFFPASVLVDAEVGCQSLYSDCPTYNAECSLVHLSDSKRFCRSGLDVVQRMIYGWSGQSTCLSRLKSCVNGHDIMFFIFSHRTENPSPQQ